MKYGTKDLTVVVKNSGKFTELHGALKKKERRIFNEWLAALIGAIETRVDKNKKPN